MYLSSGWAVVHLAWHEAAATAAAAAVGAAVIVVAAVWRGVVSWDTCVDA